MRLSESNKGWVVGFEDETWWSRLALPSMHHAWSADGEPSRLVQRSITKKDDPDPKKAISSCYGLYLPELEETTWLCASQGRPPGWRDHDAVPLVVLREAARRRQEGFDPGVGQRLLAQEEPRGGWAVVDRRAQPAGEEGQQGRGEDHRLSLAEAEPMAQPDRAQMGSQPPRRVAEADGVLGDGVLGDGVLGDGVLGAHELAERVCAAFGCPHHDHLSLAENAA